MIEVCLTDKNLEWQLINYIASNDYELFFESQNPTFNTF